MTPAAPGFGPVLRDPLMAPTTSAEVQQLRTLEALMGRITAGAGPVQTRWTTFAGNLTPEKISGAIRLCDAGQPWLWADLCEHVKEVDGHLGGIVDQRIFGAANKPMRPEPPEHMTDDYLAITLASFQRAVQVQIRNFRDALFGLLWADAMGYAVAEITWDERRIEFVAQDKSGKERTLTIQAFVPVKLDTVHPKHVVFDQGTDEPTMWLGSGRHPFPPGKFIYHVGFGIQPIVERRGYMRSCVWLHAFKHWALRDEQIWLHKYGIPQLLLRYNPQRLEQPEAKSIAAQIAKDWGQGLTGVVEDWFTGEAFTVGGDGVHRNAAIFFNQEMSKRVLGATGTVEGGLNGSYGQATVMEGVVWDVKAGSAGKLCETIQQDIHAPTIEINVYELAALLGESPEAIRARIPWLSARVERENSPSERLAVCEGLSRLGFKLSRRQIGKEFHVDEGQGADVLGGEPVQVAKGGAVIGSAHASEGVQDEGDAAPGAASDAAKGSGAGSGLQLTSTDLATIVTVNQGLASIGLPPKIRADGSPDPDGFLTVAEYKAKNEQVIAAAAQADQGGAPPAGAPPRPAQESR